MVLGLNWQYYLKPCQMRKKSTTCNQFITDLRFSFLPFGDWFEFRGWQSTIIRWVEYYLLSFVFFFSVMTTLWQFGRFGTQLTLISWQQVRLQKVPCFWEPMSGHFTTTQSSAFLRDRTTETLLWPGAQILNSHATMGYVYSSKIGVTERLTATMEVTRLNVGWFFSQLDTTSFWRLFRIKRC